MGLRRLLALVILVALVLDIGIFVVDGYAHVTRVPVKVDLAAEHEIVQVFVNCKLAYYSVGTVHRSYDLRWLRKGDILTFQIRGLKRGGYYHLSFSDGARVVPVSSRGGPEKPVSIGAGEVGFAGSWTVDGRKLGEQGCQADASQQLAFAKPRAGQWQRGSWVFAKVHSLAQMIPWLLAALGALAVATGALADRLHEQRARSGFPARVIFAAAGLAVAILSALATESFNAVFALCVAAGVGLLLMASVWLLKDDIRRLAGRLALRSPAP